MSQIETDEFARAFMNALPAHTEENNAAHAALGLSAPAITVAGICAAWPKIKAGINTAIMFMQFIPGLGSIVPLIKAFMQAADSTLIPAICGTAAAATAPTGGGRKPG